MAMSLFDANGCFGRSSAGASDFRGAEDLLAHMDRVGIDRSLVWYVPANEYNQTHGNRRIVEEIEATRGAQGRLIPASVIAPVMLYEDGAMEELTSCMESGMIRALRFFQNGVQSFTLRQLEPILDRVSPFKPLLMLRSPMGAAWINDLLLLTEKYPDITFAYMEGMWVQMPAILDLMRRRENIVIDTSYLHTRDTIKLVAEQFGAERMIFGAGSKSSGGASIAGLTYADIDDGQRELIAHGNLERILGLDATPASGRDVDRSGATLWSKYSRRESLGVEIIDVHGHLGPTAKWVMKDREMTEQIPEAIKWMDRTGVSRMHVSGELALYSDPIEGNRVLQESLANHTDRFSGYVAYNPSYEEELVPLLDGYFSGEFFVGFKILCDYWKIPLTDPRFRTVWEYANRCCLPILIHTWEGPYDTPAMLNGIVGEYPDAIFMLAHSGGTDKGRGEAETLALENSNVYLDFCGSFVTRKPWEETIELVGNDRVVFGSDGILHDQAWELGRLLSLDLPDEKIIPILAGNIKRILAKRK